MNAAVSLSTDIRMAAVPIQTNAQQFVQLFTSISVASAPTASMGVNTPPLTNGIRLACEVSHSATASPPLQTGINLAADSAHSAFSSATLISQVLLLASPQVSISANESNLLASIVFFADLFARANQISYIRDSVIPVYAQPRVSTGIASVYLRAPKAGAADLLAARIVAKPTYKLIKATRK
jgi:hypothetical protein